jgi:hypothetical protein
MSVLGKMLIRIYLKDIFSLLEIEDGLLEAITFLQALTQLIIIVRNFDVPIIVAAALDHIT